MKNRMIHMSKYPVPFHFYMKSCVQDGNAFATHIIQLPLFSERVDDDDRLRRGGGLWSRAHLPALGHRCRSLLRGQGNLVFLLLTRYLTIKGGELKLVRGGRIILACAREARAKIFPPS